MNGETTLVKEKPRSLLQVACKGYTKKSMKGGRRSSIFQGGAWLCLFYLACRIPVLFLLE